MARRMSSAPTLPGTPGKAAPGAIDGTRSNASPVVRTCRHPGCDARACYGENVQVSGDPADERWWCADHVPDRFWAAKRREESRHNPTSSGGEPAGSPSASRRRFRKGQGELL